MKKVLAVASGGGHWKQLMLITPAFEGCQQKFITTIAGLPEESGLTDFHIVVDSNKDDKTMVVRSAFQILSIIRTYKPDFVITTGAAPGLLAIIIGRLFGAKTIWIDSIANAEELSLGGKVSKKIAHVAITQWDHLAKENNMVYMGSVF